MQKKNVVIAVIVVIYLFIIAILLNTNFRKFIMTVLNKMFHRFYEAKSRWVENHRLAQEMMIKIRQEVADGKFKE